MFVTIITDCMDDATFGRQKVRSNILFDCPVIPIGINGELNEKWQIQAAGNLIDVLAVAEGAPGVVLVNSAPRSHKKRPNGTPFGYFWHGKTLVVSSIDGLTLSLVKKLNIVSEVSLLDIPTVMSYMIQQHGFDQQQADEIIHTQFRSLEFIPRVAKRLWDEKAIPATSYSLQEVDDAPAQVWLVDNFGNLKTTLTKQDVAFKPGKTITLGQLSSLSCYRRLKDVPVGEPGVIEGSSWWSDHKFLEIVIQGYSASEKLGIGQGAIL